MTANRNKLTKPPRRKHPPMNSTQHDHQDDSELTPSEIAQLEPYSEELRRLAYDIDTVIRKRASLPRCLSGIVAMRPLINLIEESAIKLLSRGDGAQRAEADPPPASEAESDNFNDSTPGYL